MNQYSSVKVLVNFIPLLAGLRPFLAPPNRAIHYIRGKKEVNPVVELRFTTGSTPPIPLILELKEGDKKG